MKTEPGVGFHLIVMLSLNSLQTKPRRIKRPFRMISTGVVLKAHRYEYIEWGLADGNDTSRVGTNSYDRQLLGSEVT